MTSKPEEHPTSSLKAKDSDEALSDLIGAALDVPAPAAPPTWAPDNTLTRTGNTADHQAGWFAGMEQGQDNAQDNAAIRAQSRDWKAIQAAIDEYLDGYELRTDEGAHTPTDFERFLLDDCIAGLLAEYDILALLAGATAPPARDALDPNHRSDLHYILGALNQLAKADPKDQELAAALNGMRYVVARTDAANAAQQGKGGEA
ncbi:hypothetical protein [Achromobacter dolens]|uniref:hypothetical protein n=1 Tax=Achromobacter dolens TaxID=1287738 RepID=UPI0031CFF8A9